MNRPKLKVDLAFLRVSPGMLRHARFAALLKDGTVIQGRIGFCTEKWFGYTADGCPEVQRVEFDDIDSAELG